MLSPDFSREEHQEEFPARAAGTPPSQEQELPRLRVHFSESSSQEFVPARFLVHFNTEFVERFKLGQTGRGARYIGAWFTREAMNHLIETGRSDAIVDAVCYCLLSGRDVVAALNVAASLDSESRTKVSSFITKASTPTASLPALNDYRRQSYEYLWLHRLPLHEARAFLRDLLVARPQGEHPMYITRILLEGSDRHHRTREPFILGLDQILRATSEIPISAQERVLLDFLVKYPSKSGKDACVDICKNALGEISHPFLRSALIQNIGEGKGLELVDFLWKTAKGSPPDAADCKRAATEILWREDQPSLRWLGWVIRVNLFWPRVGQDR